MVLLHLLEFLYTNISIFEYLMQQAHTDVASFVDRDRHPSTVRMTKDGMATALTDLDETKTFKGPSNLFRLCWV
jgi:hypothetical protein